MLTRALESSRRSPVPPEVFPLSNGPFAFLFVRAKCVEQRKDDPQQDPPKEPPKPTATDVHTTSSDGATPNPIENEELDWENDD